METNKLSSSYETIIRTKFNHKYTILNGQYSQCQHPTVFEVSYNLVLNLEIKQTQSLSK